MKILKSIALALIILIAGLQLGMLAQSYGMAHSNYNFTYPGEHVTPTERQEILRTLDILQEGYDKRDSALSDVYLEQTVSKDDILILGTSSNEVFVGYAQAKDLFESDWESWGAVTFNFQQAHISKYQDTAYFVTRGRVVMDLLSLTFPLRVSGVLIKEHSMWLIHKLQFQFDLPLPQILLSLLFSMLLTVDAALMLILFVARKLFYKRQK